MLSSTLIDEVGYLSFDDKAADLPYEVINRRYEHKPLIVTTNTLCGAPHKRKNWLHVGSAKAGPKIAAIASVVESCRRLALPVAEYLLDVLPGLASRPVSQVAQLTPARWAAVRSKP